jgi:hypothetical protein
MAGMLPESLGLFFFFSFFHCQKMAMPAALTLGTIQKKTE